MPAPLGPTSATTSPAFTVIETSVSTGPSLVGYRNVKCSIAISCVNRRSSRSPLTTVEGWSRYSNTFCEAPNACWKMLWMPTSRFTGSYSISSAITKLVNSPAVIAPARISVRAYTNSPITVTAPMNSISGDAIACCITYFKLLRRSRRPASRNRADSTASAPNDFTTWCPLSVSCRIWFTSAVSSCAFRVDRRILRPNCTVGSITIGTTVTLNSASFHDV